jgi:hypothetical protein
MEALDKHPKKCIQGYFGSLWVSYHHQEDALEEREKV